MYKYSYAQNCNYMILYSRASAEKFPRGGGDMGNEKKHYYAPSRGPTEKRPKNSTIKPLSTISVPCMKIQGRPRPPYRRPWLYSLQCKKVPSLLILFVRGCP